MAMKRVSIGLWILWYSLFLIQDGLVRGQPTFPLEVNFGRASQPCGKASRYVQDSGEFFGRKGNLIYGWRQETAPFEPQSTAARNRATTKVPCSQRGFVFMQRNFTDGSSKGDVLWQLNGVSNGLYTVEVLVGDALRTDSTHVINANGRRILGPVTPTEPGVRIRGEGGFRVTNGRIRISAKGGTNTKIQRLVIIKGGVIATPTPVPGVVPDRAVINFLPSTSPGCGPNTIGDFGQPYGLQPDGLEHGWINPLSDQPADASRATVDRGTTPCAFSTFISMRSLFNPFFVWRIAPVPRGSWRVTVLCGEPFGFDSTHVIEANGVRILGPRIPFAEGERIEGANVVEVDDEGSITLSANNGGRNTKLSRVLLERVVATPSPRPPRETRPPPLPECVPFPSEFGGKLISNQPCETVRINAPFRMNFRGRRDGVADGSQTSTDFTMFLPSSRDVGYYDADLLEVVRGRGLRMGTTSGRMRGGRNAQVNALGVALDLPAHAFSVTMTWQIPEGLTGRGERACLFFGNSDKKFVEFCIVSWNDRVLLNVYVEQDDVQLFGKYMPTELSASREVVLGMQILPETAEVATTYRTSGALEDFVRTTVPREFFSFDAAQQDFRIGGRSFVGPLVSQYNGPATTFFLTSFDVVQLVVDDVGELTPGIDWFTSFIDDIPFPTALVIGPDGKLYSTNADCDLTVVTFAGDGYTETGRRIHRPLGQRLCLGVDVDPESTPDNVILWLSHSDSSQDDGEANSGKVTRLSGEDFAIVDDIIVGLPRAVANHAPNQLHFGPDGRLYLTVGGNTGGGAPNPNSPTFGFRPEQCLSAALLVADVKQAGFRGDCTPTQDPQEMDRTGVALEECADLCDVQVHASGLRNSYDHTWRLGQIFATDNGLGGTGTSPLLPPSYQQGDSCSAPVPVESIPETDPGARDDLLIRVEEGKYYGHPNPSRRECLYFGANPTAGRDLAVPRLPIFLGETYAMETDIYPAGTPPDEKYAEPLISIGLSRSPNGIIAYAGDAFCGQLKDDLIMTWFSTNDQLRWLHMNPTGTAVTADEPLRRSRLETGAQQPMRNPLALTQNSDGYIFAAEFLGGRIRVFRPRGGGCATRTRSVAKPAALVDASGVVVAQRKLFVFGGATGNADDSETADVSVFDPTEDRWDSVQSLPSPARSISAISLASDAEEVFLFGGFQNGVALRSALLRSEGTYKQLPEMPEPRGGASVFSLDARLIVIVGGATTRQGSAQRSSLAYDSVTKTWSATRIPAMQTARKYATTAVTVGNVAYICGGVDQRGEALSSCEAWDGSEWSVLPDMPSPRSHAGAVAAGDKLVVKGGEWNGTLVADIIEYNPSIRVWRSIAKMRLPRSQGVVHRIRQRIYSFAGRIDAQHAPHAEILEYE